jgi:WW domain-containing oxidoreductase
VQACAVDPGAVRSNIWANNPKFNRGPGKAVIDACYAPPEDAARVLLHAATCDWQADAPSSSSSSNRPRQESAAVPPEEDLRYYARGVFAWPQVWLRMYMHTACSKQSMLHVATMNIAV